MAIRVLFLGVEPKTGRFFRNETPSRLLSQLSFHSPKLHTESTFPRSTWDLIIIGNRVKEFPELVKWLRSSKVPGIKIILADAKNLDSAVSFWGTGVYSYLLMPLNPKMSRFIWHSALDRVQLVRKMSRISAQKRKDQAWALEDLFRAQLKIQELGQERRRFLGHTAHELRSPLTALQGYLALLGNEKAGTLSPLQRKALDQADHSLQRLLNLTRSLLDLDSLAGEPAELCLEAGDIEQCLEAAVRERRPDANAKDMQLSVEYSSGLPQFRFDFGRLQQVFVNLIDNAIKFTERGGKISVRCKADFWERRTIREKLFAQPDRREAGAPFRNNCIRVVVEDTGVGIPPEDMPDIFREYFRGSTANASRPGFGLGLAVVSQIVAAHSGKIWAESQPGQGSRFTVLIPTDEAVDIRGLQQLTIFEPLSLQEQRAV